jgi:hypothetical protein
MSAHVNHHRIKNKDADPDFKGKKPKALKQKGARRLNQAQLMHTIRTTDDLDALDAEDCDKQRN